MLALPTAQSLMFTIPSAVWLIQPAVNQLDFESPQSAHHDA